MGKIKGFIRVYGFAYMLSWGMIMSIIYFSTILSGNTQALLTFNDYNEVWVEFPLFIVGFASLWGLLILKIREVL